MTVKLNTSGAAHATALIASGDYDDTASWSFSAADGDKLLGPDGKDWANYDRFHLGEVDGEKDGTKAKYDYPYGKDGKVFGNALRAIRSRASTNGATAVFDAAGKLLDQLKAKEAAKSAQRRDNALVLPFARKSPAQLNYRVKNASADSAELYLYDMIGSWGISADMVARDLKALGDVKVIDCRINSEGGDVFDATAIYTLLAQHKATVNMHIDGLAASAASVIAMAGDRIDIAESGFVMIHNASGACMGTAPDLRRTADLLDMVSGTIADTYAARTRQPLAQIKQWMDDETWMAGPAAVKNGFADILVENQRAVASIRDPARYRRLPQALRPRRAAAQAAIARLRAAVA